MKLLKENKFYNTDSMRKLRSILVLDAFAKTLSENDLVSQQRLRLFRITTLFAVIVFAGILYQVSAAVKDEVFLLSLLSFVFIAVFINYFGLAIHKKTSIAYILLPGLLFLVLHIVSYGQGGIRNSGMSYLAAIILTAFILLGKKGGKVMAGISIIHVIYFYFITLYTGWVNYSLIGTDPGLIDLDFLITGMLSILVLTAQTNYIEKSKNAVTDDIKSKRDELATINIELLKAKKALEIKNKEFEQKNIELEQFAYVASHDLQEPLRTTSGFIKILRQQYRAQLDEKADKYIDYVLDSTRRMQVLISDLLEYSRIGRKKEMQKFDCTQILNEVLADLAITIQETGAEIKAGQLPVISGYPTEIKLLFQNLIFNAIKFRRKDSRPEISINVTANDNDWQFSFEDNGIGIAKEYNERIFIIFQRLHTRSEYSGSGIGLSHCKKIVEIHNGRIWLESELGKGSTFHFTLSNNN
jgi:signal transduction histidine kinase